MQSKAVTQKLTNSQVQTLNSIPFTIIPTPGANKMIVVTKAFLFYDYGSAAFAGIASGEDLQLRYTNGSGVLIAQCETTGFLDQTNDESRIVYPNNGTVAVMEVDGAPDNLNEGVVLCLSTGDITTGTGCTLQVTVFYDIVNKI